MKKTIIILLTIPLIMISCNKYPKSELYVKGYDPGKHENLRLDGYYENDIEMYKSHAETRDQAHKEPIQPLFFFADGSTVFLHAVIDSDRLTTNLEKQHEQWWTWGNFQIKSDTITIEWIQNAQYNFKRVTEKGILYRDSIAIFTVENSRPITPRTLHFIKTDIKPDSSFNWIRTDERYN